MCTHPVLYHVDGRLKCIACGEFVDKAQQNSGKQAVEAVPDAGANKSPAKKRQAKNAK
jgi:hypothetical protein